MMLYPSIMDLMEKAGNRYSLVIAASKRARDILEDAKEESNIDGARSITRAVEEIAEGTILVVNETKEQEEEREAVYQAKVEALEAAEQKQAEEAAEVSEETEAE